MKRFASFLSAALVVLFSVVNFMPASAATSSDGSSGLSINPRKNYVINPGQSVTDKLTISNLDSDSGLALGLRMIDFSFNDQSGTPKLLLADNAPQTSWSLKPYTSLPKTVNIGPGATQTISYTITIPKNLGAGSYYSAIMYQSQNPTGGNVGLNASGVTLVFVSVPGTVKENMTLQKMGAYDSTDNGTTGSYVYIATQDQPQMIAYALKNTGNVTEAPAGTITLKDMWGHQVKSIDQTNQLQQLALIGQTRLFATCIKTVQQKIQLEGGTSTNTSCTNPGLWPGLYTASLDIFYGQNGNQTHEVTGTAHFWYLPVWFIVVCVVVLLLIAWGIWWVVRKIKGGSKKRRLARR